MDWAIGIASTPSEIELIGTDSELQLASPAALSKVGIPSTSESKRLAYEGDLSSWLPVDAQGYLNAFGIKLPKSVQNRQQVFSRQIGAVTAHVPALVLMRAFFRPMNPVLPAVFRPASIDELSFVNYSASPPDVVIDHRLLGRRISEIDRGTNQGIAMRWLQLSKSAKQTAHSVHRHARQGELSLCLPSGKVRMILHGRLVGEHLYATKAALISVAITGSDSLTGNQEEFVFHAIADSTQGATASIRNITVPRHADGSVNVTDTEWQSIKKFLMPKNGRQTPENQQRALLNAMLYKLATGIPWKKIPTYEIPLTRLTAAFRRWSMSGKLDQILDYLKEFRKVTSPA